MEIVEGLETQLDGAALDSLQLQSQLRGEVRENLVEVPAVDLLAFAAQDFIGRFGHPTVAPAGEVAENREAKRRVPPRRFQGGRVGFESAKFKFNRHGETLTCAEL